MLLAPWVRRVAVPFALVLMVSSCGEDEPNETCFLPITAPDTITVVAGASVVLQYTVECGLPGSPEITSSDTLVARLLAADSLQAIAAGYAAVYYEMEGEVDSTIVRVLGFPWRGLVDSAPLMGVPAGVAVRPGSFDAWITLYEGTALVKADLRTRLLGGTSCCLDSTALRIAFEPNGQRAWVVLYGDHAVVPFDRLLGTFGAPVPLGGRPLGIAVHPGGGKLYVTTDLDSLFVIDLPGGTVAKSMKLVTAPGALGLAFTASGSRLYVGSTWDGVVEIDTEADSVLRTIGAPGMEAVATTDGDTELVLTVSAAPRGVYFYDRVSGAYITYIPTASQPFDIVRTPDGGHFIVSLLEGKVILIDAATRAPIDTFVVGGTPRRIALSPEGGTALVTNEDGFVTFLR